MVSIRPLTLDDLPLVLRLTEQAGWNQTPADVRRFLAMQPDGCFLAERQGDAAGTVATFDFGAVAWVAMVLVDAKLRGQGIGRALMDYALAHLEARGIPTIRLDATPLGLPLYEKLGFVSQFSMTRFAGKPLAIGVPDLAGSSHDSSRLKAGLQLICPAADDDLESILQLDREVTRTDRRNLIQHLFREQRSEFRICRQANSLAGYAVLRPGANAAQIGPCLGDDRAGAMLLTDALQRKQGQMVYVDLPSENASAVALAQSRGLQVQRQLTRMCRGVPVIEQQEWIWAGSGPEKG